MFVEVEILDMGVNFVLCCFEICWEFIGINFFYFVKVSCVVVGLIEGFVKFMVVFNEIFGFD